MINARAESLAETPAFKHLVGCRRCIIPADGFYEWRKQGKRKVPMWVILGTGSCSDWPVCGTYGASPTGSGWSRSSSSPRNPMNWCDRYTTACPSSSDRKTKSNGLTLLEHFSSKAKSLLKPYPEELMDAHDVSTIVNSAKYDGPECIQPAEEDDMPHGRQLSLL